MKKLKGHYLNFTNYVGDKLSNGLSTMEMFYIVAILVLFPLIVQRPTDLISWIQYISTAVLQAVSLPLLGYTTKKSGDIQGQMIKETRDMILNEIEELKDMHEDLHELIEVKSKKATKTKKELK